MPSGNVYVHSYPESQRLRFIKTSALPGSVSSSFSYLAKRKDSPKKSDLPYNLFEGVSKDEEPVVEKIISQTPLSFIEDPLWKRVCREAIRLMGSPAHQMGQARLGPLSPQDTTIELYCQTDKIASFLQQYDFVILGILREYFPSVKKLRVRFN